VTSGKRRHTRITFIRSDGELKKSSHTAQRFWTATWCCWRLVAKLKPLSQSAQKKSVASSNVFFSILMVFGLVTGTRISQPRFHPAVFSHPSFLVASFVNYLVCSTSSEQIYPQERWLHGVYTSHCAKRRLHASAETSGYPSKARVEQHETSHYKKPICPKKTKKTKGCFKIERSSPRPPSLNELTLGAIF